MRAFRCDRCGAYMEKSDDTKAKFVSVDKKVSVGIMVPDWRFLDLCKECSDEFAAFIEGGAQK